MSILYRWLILAVVSVSFGAVCWFKGAASVQKDWDAATLAAAQHVEVVQTKRAEVTEKVVTEYRDRVKVIREQGRTIEKEVIKYVPLDSCTLPGGFRVLHDAATGGELPASPDGADAAPVTATEVATTVSINYTECRVNAENLAKLQQWAQDISEIK